MSYEWPKEIEERVNKFADSKGLKSKKKTEFINAAYDRYKESYVPIYEPVGLLAAQSMGEPATQLILRTKHYAGAAEVSVGSGIERLEGLVDARSKTKYPIMTIFIKKELPKDDKNMQKYLKELIFKKLSDICEIKEDLASKRIIVKYRRDLMKELDINADFVKDKIKTMFKAKVKESDTGIECIFDDASLVTIRKYYVKLVESNIKGIEGINDAIISDENGEKVIKTQGTNFKSVTAVDFVDAERTYTNDIFETYKVLGIEAARNLLVKEICGVYNSAGIGIDIRHVFLLADTMCYDGTVKGVVRTGIVSTKASPLARAAFEQTEKVIFDSAFEQESEKFIGVVENVMAGLPINVGVGNIELIMDFNAQSTPIEAPKYVKPEKKIPVIKPEDSLMRETKHVKNVLKDEIKKEDVKLPKKVKEEILDKEKIKEIELKREEREREKLEKSKKSKKEIVTEEDEIENLTADDYDSDDLSDEDLEVLGKSKYKKSKSKDGKK